MAVVVTARSTVDAPRELAASPLPRVRTGRTVGPLAFGAAALYVLSLVANSLSRLAPPGSEIAFALQVCGVAALAAVLALAGVAWIVQRHHGESLLAITLAALLAVTRLVLGEVLQTLELRTLAAAVDLGLGLAVLSCLVWSTVSTSAAPTIRARSLADVVFRRVVATTALLLFGLALSGATVRAIGAGWACEGTFPDCNGLGALPFGRDPLADVQLYHRMLAYIALGLVAWITLEALRGRRHLLRPALGLAGATLAEGAIGVASISSSNAVLTQALHTGGAALTVWAAVGLTALAGRAAPTVASRRAEVGSTALAGRAAPTVASRRAEVARLSVVSAYVQLTKPRVMSLLLATTAASMVIAARGMPDLGVFVATLLGGALMSGGAGAINHFVDRDIDPLMGRTAWRPIPSGVISPARALAFGILLAVIASAVFLVFVNALACVLAVLGLLGYVFIYTLWLKRSTPSNIVIGGAAGALPPMVGWAAVTNEVSSLTVWYLFAIIFFWTPPHFWALSLLIRQHYERAGIPMLPVVRGEDETRRQIVLYSILLVVLTLVLSPFGMMGAIYFGAAAILGALFIRDAVHLWRRATREAARRLYLYSLLYLFALFCAMAVDRAVLV